MAIGDQLELKDLGGENMAKEIIRVAKSNINDDQSVIEVEFDADDGAELCMAFTSLLKAIAVDEGKAVAFAIAIKILEERGDDIFERVVEVNGSESDVRLS